MVLPYSAETILTSLPDLKNTTDDALAPYLTSLPKPYRFTVNNLNTDIRLLLGYSAVAIAGVTFYVDRKLNWAALDAWVAGAVIAYFILNTALTYWIWGVEAGQVFSGTRDGGEKVRFPLLSFAIYIWNKNAFTSHIPI